MPSSMTKISSVTVESGGSASVTFSSIPQTYTDLVVKASVRTDRSNDNNDNIQVKPNNSTSSLTFRMIRGNGSSAASNSTANWWGFVDGNLGATANTFGNTEIYIPNYTSSNYKSFSSDSVSENNATEAYASMSAILWSDTTAISSLVIVPVNGSNFLQYTTFTLYGVTKYAETGTGSKATGGTVTTSGGYTYHTFFSSGVFTPTAAITGAEVLVVAGGGGSGAEISGGGGAGGLVYASSQSYTSGVNYAAIVGAGGGNTAPYNTVGNQGNSSVFASGTVAVGGGGGGGAGQTGGNGGSGGGGGATGEGLAGTGTVGQGNAGARGSSGYGGGGGGAGGAGVLGGTNTRGGDGGVGVNTYSAWGSATATGDNIGGTYWYAGGGGGSPWNGVSANTIGGKGGSGGGGFGGDSGAGGPKETSGLPNTGGGAGGGNAGGATAGGSGIVIVRYTT